MKFYKVRLRSNPKLTLEDSNSVCELRKWWPTAIGRTWESAEAAFKAIHEIRRATAKILAREDFNKFETHAKKSWKTRAAQVEDMEVIEYSIPDEAAVVVKRG